MVHSCLETGWTTPVCGVVNLYAGRLEYGTRFGFFVSLFSFSGFIMCGVQKTLYEGGSQVLARADHGMH